MSSMAPYYGQTMINFVGKLGLFSDEISNSNNLLFLMTTQMTLPINRRHKFLQILQTFEEHQINKPAPEKLEKYQHNRQILDMNLFRTFQKV